MTLGELRSEALRSELLRPELSRPERLWSLQVRELDGDGALPVFVGFPAPELDGDVSFS
jgi:hypothetical protein